MKKSQMRRSRWCGVSALAIVFGLSAAAYADDVSQETGGGFDMLDSMAVEEMDHARGREGTQVDLVNVQSIQDMDATTVGSKFNVGGDMISGPITYEKGSMGHYSGTGIFNNVTGSANAINNAIGISVYISNP